MLDAFPTDPSESLDTDGDGVGNVQDIDADNDGVPDDADPFPLDATRSSDIDGDGIDDANDDDIDGDGIANADDPDSDGNGIDDNIENNTAPIANSDVFDIVDTMPVTIDVLANDTDTDNDVLTILGARSKIGEVSVENNLINYSAPENYTGSIVIDYQISDPFQGTAQSIVLVNINTFDAAGDAPLVLPPEDVEVNATGLFTKVDLGVATATDSQGNPLPVSLVDGITYFKPGINTAYWEAVDENGNRSVTSQEVRVRPLVSFGKDQVVMEGTEATVNVLLNGESPTYPLTINYAVSGDADATDHTLNSGTITIDSGTSGSVRFSVNSDAITEPDETVTVRFTGELNSVSDASHQIVITESRQAPEVLLNALQSGENRLRVARDQGTVSLQAIVKQTAPGETFIYTWSVEGNMQDQDSVEQFFTFDPDLVTQGVYLLSVTVDSSEVQTPSVTQSIELAVLDTLENLSINNDTDDDNIPDSQEGYEDTDADGIPDFADSIAESNVLPSLSGVFSGYLVEGEPGVSLRIGKLSVLSERDGALISQTVIETTDEQVTNLGGVFDFEIRGLPEPGQPTNIVLPQQRGIVENAIYRKYTVANGWADYVVDADNRLASTLGELGYCPPPNSDVWVNGLNAGDFCIRLTIQDGGPNDADGIANGNVIDPGGMGIVTTGNSIPEAQDDSIRMLFNTSATIDVLANDSDPDGDTLSIVQASSDFGEAQIVSNEIVFTPIQNYFGNVTLNYAIDDGFGVFDYGVVQIEILVDDTPAGANPDNVAPAAINDTASTDDRTPITIDVLANDVDANGDALTLSQANTTSGTVEIIDNQLLFTPATGIGGEVVLTYTVVDETNLSDEGRLSVQVSTAVSVRNKSSGSISLYLGILLGCVCLARKLRGFTTLLLVLATGLSTTAIAQTSLGINQPRDNRLYIQLGVNQNIHSTSETELSNSLQDHSGTLQQYDNSDSGGQIGINYVHRNRWMLSIGYRLLGELDNSWDIDTPNPTQSVQDIQTVMPTLGDGFYAGLGYRQPMFSRFFAQASLEAQQWQQEFTTSGQGILTLTEERDGISPVVALGVGAHLSDSATMALNIRRFDFEGEAVNSFTLNFEWTPLGHKRRRDNRLADSVTTVGEKSESVSVVEPSLAAAKKDTPAAESVASQPLKSEKTPELQAAKKSDHQPDVSKHTIYFGFNDKELDKPDLDVVNDIVQTYRPGNTISLTGWADVTITAETSSKASKAYNILLANKRARAVKAALVQRGLPGSSISVSGRVTTSTASDARRVEAVIQRP